MASTGQSNQANASKTSPTTNTKPNRLPAPTLFVGPPSRNASNISVSRVPTHEGTLNPSRAPLLRQKSGLAQPYNPDADSSGVAGDGSQHKDTASQSAPALKKASEKELQARWREMQNTLNEVEITAQSSTHVFGEDHARALDRLRQAQVELARAWGRGSEENGSNASTFSQMASENEVGKSQINRFQGADKTAADRIATSRQRSGTESSVASTALSGESDQSTTGTRNAKEKGSASLEDETAQDIKLAGERRAANEAYFRKVDQGVRDVVAKLELVAQAMRSVESESRSLWSGSESLEAEETPAEGTRD